MRGHEKYVMFWLLRKGNTDETHTWTQRTSNYCIWSSSYGSVKCGRKTKIGKRHQIFKV